MKRLAICLAALLATTSAFALQPAKEKLHCKPLAQVEKDFAKFVAPDKAEFTRVTPGQFHFLQGAYALSPDTPPGLPPADFAILAKAEKTEGGVILFARGGLMCSTMSAPKQLIALMSDVLTGPLTGDGDEM